MSNENIYQAISAVQKDLAAVGLGKTETNTYDKYQYRGIDGLYNTLSPILAKNNLCILPRVLTREVAERASNKGSLLFYVTLEVEFDLVSGEDGSKHTIKVFGEAMDRGDKATNKAMTAAYKYACFQLFCIPLVGDEDADNETHEVAVFSEAERRAVFDFLEGGDSMGFTAYLGTLSQAKQEGINGSFEKDKTRNKQKWRALESEGFNKWATIQTDLISLAQEDNQHSIFEIISEMTSAEQRYLIKILGTDAQRIKALYDEARKVAA